MNESNLFNGGQVIIDYLIREKVPYLFGLCGHSNIGLIDALHERAGDLGDAILAGIASGWPYLIDANIGGDLNPPGAGVWELPGMGFNKPAFQWLSICCFNSKSGNRAS